MKENKNKKTNKKKLMLFGGIGLLLMVFVAAAIITNLISVVETDTFTQSITINGEIIGATLTDSDEIFNGWEQKETSEGYVMTNAAGRDLAVAVSSSDNTGIGITYDTIGLSTDWSSNVDANADASLNGEVVTLIADEHAVDWSDASESRINIDGSDVEVLVLNDLLTMSWDVDVNAGYIAHIDVFVDTNDDGIADDSLVFEYAKVDPSIGCDEGIGNYPTGDGINTFGDKGIVDSEAKAWLSSGPSGGCTTQAFIDNWLTLNEWKAGGHSSGISGTTKVLRFEIEVDGWISDSESEISNIVINGNAKEMLTLTSPITIDKNSDRTIYINKVFDQNLEAGIYETDTTITYA